MLQDQACAPEDSSPHQRRRNERATLGSVAKIATGMARSLVGCASGRLAMT